MKGLVQSVLFAGVLGACSAVPPAPTPIDPIVVPEAAVSVDHMTLFRNESWTPINQRMLLAHAGPKHFLLIFNTPCPPLRHRNPQIIVRAYSHNELYANSDLLSVGNMICPLNDIYSILEEDATALKARANR
jgi:Family of unknown function (DUF6491)